MIQIPVMGQKGLEESLAKSDLSVATTLGDEGSLNEITPALHIQMNKARKGLSQDLIVSQVFDQDQAFHLAGWTTPGDAAGAGRTITVHTAQGLYDENLGGTEVSELDQGHLFLLKQRKRD